MFSEYNNDMLALLVKSNPEVENAINIILADHKKATSMLVHELRNPLSLMKGTVQYIELKHPEAKTYKYWDQLNELISDMEHIMADASLLNTYNNIHKENTNLLLLVENLADSFMPQALTKEIELSLTFEPESEAFLTSYSCDGVKLKQALTNLVKNAFEATSPGNFIHIGLKYLPEGVGSTAKLSIEISNNGQPIPETDLENIFVPFVTFKKSGTGIGLALVKKVVDMHYGSISVQSDEALTAFIIQLPA